LIPDVVAGLAWHRGGVQHSNQRRETHLVNDIRASLRRDGLVRPQEGRVLAGVCAGLGRRFGIDPWPARLLFVLLLLVIPGSQLLVYPILWILMPAETTTDPAAYPPAPAAGR
jgi:phage shock protein C